MPRKSLSDILNGGGNYFDGWSNVRPADEFGPVPNGVYVAKIIRGTLDTSKMKGTPGYTLEFVVAEGEYAGRHIWYTIWLTDASKSQAKRDFDKLGMTDPKTQLELPLPPGMVCEINVTLRTNDAGVVYNHLRNFVLVRIEPPTPDPFAPASANGNHQADGNDVAADGTRSVPATIGEAKGGEPQ